jgi:hypothetical protein
MFNFHEMIARNAEGVTGVVGAGSGAGGEATQAGATGADTVAGAGGAAQPWYASHPDAEVRTFLNEQKIEDPAIAATKLYHANKALGGSTDVVVKPPAGATPEQQEAFYNALGRPASPDAYDFGLGPEIKVDEGFKTWAQQTFHKTGVTADQAKAIVGAWQTFQADYAGQMQAQMQVQDKAAIDALKQEYGAGFDKFVADGQKAQAALGLPEAHLNALAASAGTPAYLALMAALGKKMGGEGSFVNANGGGGEIAPNQMSPEQARVEISRLQGDATFQAKYLSAAHPEHRAAVQRMEQLFARAEAKSAA